MHNFKAWIDRRIGIGGQSVEAMLIIEERMVALKPRLIWLYVLISLYLIGVELSLRASGIHTWNAAPMALILITRLTYWVRHRQTIFRGDVAKSALRKVAFGALTVGFGYLFLLGAGSTQIDAMTWQMLLLSGSGISIGGQMLPHQLQDY